MARARSGVIPRPLRRDRPHIYIDPGLAGFLRPIVSSRQFAVSPAWVRRPAGELTLSPRLGSRGVDRGKTDAVVRPAADERAAIAELRLFISLYHDVDVQPGSRIARKLEAARRAVAAYKAAEKTRSDGARSA